MKLKSVKIENYRAIEKLDLPLDPSLTVFHGANGCGKTSVLSAIAWGLWESMGSFSCVLGLDFSEEDQRKGAEDPWISLTDGNGVTHEWRGNREGVEDKRKMRLATLPLQKEGMIDNSNLPIIAFYDTDRTVSGVPQSVLPPSNEETAAWILDHASVPQSVLAPNHSQREKHPLAALDGALSARTDFEALFAWFYAVEDEELREQKERRDFGYQLKELSAVRQAISSMLPEVSDPRIKLNPLRFVVSIKSNGRVENLSLDQLSGGYRIVLALAADLARRMAQGNPHLDDPLESKAVVLIDEIELHLHPAWQQRVLDDLRRTFPNTQFIVSTHSPQVLTTAKPQHIVELHRDGDLIEAGAPAGATYGAEAGDVLSVVMGVNERPPENEFTKALEQYRNLIREGQWASKKALALRKKLKRMSPDDPALDRANLEIKRRELFEQMAKSQ